MGEGMGGPHAAEGRFLQLKVRTGFLKQTQIRAERHGGSRNVRREKRKLTTYVCLDRLPSYCQSEEVRG